MTISPLHLVEFWPLADVAKLKLKDGDKVVLRTTRRLTESQRARIGDALIDGWPGVVWMLLDGDDRDGWMLALNLSARAMIEGDL